MLARFGGRSVVVNIHALGDVQSSEEFVLINAKFEWSISKFIFGIVKFN